MEDFIEDPNPFCIQIVEGYIIQTTPSDSESCLAPDQFGNYCICRSRGDNPAKIGCCFICNNNSEYSDYVIQIQIKYRIYVNSKMESQPSGSRHLTYIQEIGSSTLSLSTNN